MTVKRSQPSDPPARAWIRRHPYRFVVYVLALVACAAALIIPRWCCREKGLLTTLANLGALHRTAGEIGISYSVGSIRASFHPSWTVELHDIDLGFTGPPLIINTSRIDLSGHGVLLGGIDVGTAAAHNLITIDRLQADLFFRKVETYQAQVFFGAAPTDSYLSAGQITVTGLSLPRSPNDPLEVGRVAVEDVESTIRPAPNGVWNFAGLTSLRALLDGLTARPLFSPETLYRLMARLRALLVWVVAGTVILLAVFKLVLVRGLRLRLALDVLVAAAAVLPIICYVLLFPHFSMVSFLLLSLLASLLLAVLLERTVYRAGKEWHQRWEPFTLDVLGAGALLTMLSAHGLVPKRPITAPSIKVVDASVRSLRAIVRDPQLGEGALASLVLPEINAHDATVVVDPLSTELRSINLGRASFQGSLIGGLPSTLKAIRWLPRTWLEPGRVILCGNVRDSGLPAPAIRWEGCAGDSTDSPWVATDVAVKLGLAPLNANYAVETRAKINGVDSVIGADGNEHSAYIRKVESLPGSKVQIRSGSGGVALGSGLTARLALNRLQFRDSLLLRSIETRLAIPALDRPADLDAALTLGGVTATTNQGMAAVRSCRVLFHQASKRYGQAISLGTRVEDLTASARRPGDLTDWLAVELPLIRLQVAGETKGALIPRSFLGNASMDIERWPGRLAFGTERPVRFSADVQQGSFDVAEQPVSISQSVLPQAPAALDLRVSANGELVSLGAPFEARTEARCRIPRLVPDILPLRSEITDIDIAGGATLRANSASAQVRYSTGWNTLTLPNTPKAAELKSVSRLSLESEGALPVLPSAGQLLDLVKPAIEKLRALPGALPAQVTFKLEGDWPAATGKPILQVRTPAGAGIRANNVSLDLDRIRVSQASLQDLEARISTSGIQTLDGHGDLEVLTGLSISDNNADLVVSIPLAPRDDRLAFKLHRATAGMNFRLISPLATGPLIVALDPFLNSLGVNFDGIEPKAKVNQLDAEAWFSGASLSALDVTTELAPGRMATVDFARLFPAKPAPLLKRLDVSLDSANPTRGFRINATSKGDDPDALRVEILAESAPLTVQAVDLANREYRTRFSVTTDLSLQLYSTSAPPQSLILKRFSAAADGFRRSLTNALRAFGNGLASQGANGPLDISWRLGVRNRSAEIPLVSLDSKTCGLAWSADLKDLTWSAGPGQPLSRISSKAEVQTNIRVEGNGFVADGEVPLDVHLALAGAAAQHLKLSLPFAILVAEQLRAAPQDSGWLWDGDYYRSFWQTYRPSYASDERAILDAREVIVGPLSVQQVEIPARALRVALGYAGGIQLDMPVVSRIMYGSIGGDFQARLGWTGASPASSPSAVLDTRLNLQMRDLQTGALGLSSQAGTTPIVVDRLDGTVALTTDGLVLNRSVLSGFMKGSVGPAQLDTLAARVELRSSPPDPRALATFQGMTFARLDFLNQALNQLAKDLNLQAPPRVLRYTSFSLDFEIAGGKVVWKPAIVEVRGMSLYSAADLQLNGKLRVHLGTPEQNYPLESLVFMAQRFFSAGGLEWAAPAPGGLRVVLGRNP